MTYTREELDRLLAEAKAETERLVAEARAKARTEVAIQVRYEIFCEQRIAMKRHCIRSCRNTECWFVPPSNEY